MFSYHCCHGLVGHVGCDRMGVWDATGGVCGMGCMLCPIRPAALAFHPAESPQVNVVFKNGWQASAWHRERERERGGMRCTRLLHTDESVPSTTAAQTDNKTRLTYSFGNSPSTKQHKRLFCWHTTTGGGNPSFRLGMHKSGLGSPVARRGWRQHGEGSARRGWANGVGGVSGLSMGGQHVEAVMHGDLR